MLTLVMRTDKPEAELYVYKDDSLLAEHKWEAHRELSNTIHKEITEILAEVSKTRNDIEKVVIFEGPGSFTGLRIGFSVANAIGFGLGVPVVASGGEDWIVEGLKNMGDIKSVVPKYGREPHITKPRK